MNKFSLFAVLTLIFGSAGLAPKAWSRDVFSADTEARRFVKVSIQDDALVQFEICSRQHQEDCQKLGREPYHYTQTQLAGLAASLRHKGVGATFLNFLVFSAGAAAGFFVGRDFAFGWLWRQPMIYWPLMAGATVAGGTSGVALAQLVKPLRYSKYFEKADMFSEELLEDQEVVVEDIEKFAHKLDESLKTL